MSVEKPTHYRPTRESLLHELEDLKHYLSPDKSDIMPLKEEPQEIPVLTDISQSQALEPPDHLLLEEELAEQEFAEEQLTQEQLAKEELAKEETIAPSENEVVEPAATKTDSGKYVASGAQQSLFDIEEKPQKASRPAAKGENPFLPQHIRERLTQNKNSILEELAHVGESLNRHDKSSSMAKQEHSSDDPDDALIDELVAKYLPKIEFELRARLKEQLKK